MPNKKKTAPKPMWYDQRLWTLGFGLVAWFGAYYFALQALNTASTWQYLAMFLLAVFGLNRLVRFAQSFVRQNG